MLLFCATDAGGARELIPVIKEALERKMPCHVLCSAVTQPIFSGSDITAEECVLRSLEDAQESIREHKALALVLGTTGVVKNERYLTAAAQYLGLPSIVVLDEWYNYHLRFEDEEGKIGKYLPTVICVQDPLSQQLAVQDGLPEGIIRIMGSPALGTLSKRAHAFIKNPPDVPKLLEDCRGHPTILFLSEALKSAYGSAQGERSTHGAFLGYDEDSVRQDLADVLMEIGKKSTVLEKLHPAEHAKSPPRHAKLTEWRMSSPSEALLPLLWHTDIIVGMHTKALLEAAILGRKPISYQPQARHPHSCTAVRLGVALLCGSRDELLRCLKERMEKGDEERGTLPRFPFANHDAAEKVLTIVKNSLSRRERARERGTPSP